MLCLWKISFVLAAASRLLQEAAAGPLIRRASPTVTLDNGTFTGKTSLTGKSEKFLGIPYAQPPTGPLRFNLPAAIPPYNGDHDATSFGLSCLQQKFTFPMQSQWLETSIETVFNDVYNFVTPQGEDCLSINVVRPSDVKADSKLPVAVFVLGGGFEIGATEVYDGSVIVERSMELAEPVIYVSMNYRLSGLGFLASQEIKNAGVGNLGLQDQREALRWVQKYIGAFGGDPTKVTLWGQSAGAISTALHMVTNNGDVEGLFRAGFMQSGSPIPVGDISHGQKYYDALVQDTGCSGASDTLECLRSVPFEQLSASIELSPGLFSYQSLNLAWIPRVDGKFLTDIPLKLVECGNVANIPIVNGDVDDEGTLFAFSSQNVTTDNEFVTYMKSELVPNLTDAEAQRTMQLYPSDPSQGSPFDTGILNALTPQFKRLGAIFGDAVFQAPRRFFLNHLAGKQKIWTYIHKRNKWVPYAGSAHATDLLDVYAYGEMTDYLINFVNHLDPNGAGGRLNWPEWTPDSPQMLSFNWGLPRLSVTQDDFRKDGIAFLSNLFYNNPL